MLFGENTERLENRHFFQHKISKLKPCKQIMVHI
jgi:hypothetical protein